MLQFRQQFVANVCGFDVWFMHAILFWNSQAGQLPSLISHAQMPAFKQTLSDINSAEGMSSSKARLASHTPRDLHAMIVALKLIKSGKTLNFGIWANTTRALGHCPLFSHALMLALKVISFGKIRLHAMLERRYSACCHCPAFSRALMAALTLISLGCAATVHQIGEQC